VAEPARAATNPLPANAGPRRRLIAVIAGVIVLAAIAAAAFFWGKPAPAPAVSAGAPQDKTPQGSTDKPASPVNAGFDWSGLSPEELHAARLALDAAIAKEEQAAAAKAAAATAAAGSNRPSVP
jgi:hypothetical protein